MPSTSPDRPSAIPADHPLYRAAGRHAPDAALDEHRHDVLALRRATSELLKRAAADGDTLLGPQLLDLSGRAAALPETEPLDPGHLAVWTDYRRLYKLQADTAIASSWQSPAILHSGPAQKAAHQEPVLPFQNDYQRYAVPLSRQEAALDALFDPVPGRRQRTWLFSSGMAAFATVLQALNAKPSTRLVGHHLYFESARLLAQCGREAVTVDETDVKAVLRAIAEHQPDQVFLDPLANSSDLPALPFAELIEALAGLPGGRPRTLVMDTTLLGAAFQPAEWLQGRPWPASLQLVTYRSLQKLDQDGLDLVSGGAVTAWSGEPLPLENWRQLCGALPTEQALRMLPLPDRQAWLAKLARHERNVTLLAEFLAQLPSPWLGAVRLADRRQLHGHVGPLFWVEWADSLSGEDAHRFLSHLVRTAERRGVPLAYGTSFGFPVTRVAAFTRTGGRGTSLRIAPGTENLARLARVADVWQEALAGFGSVTAEAYRTAGTSDWQRLRQAMSAALSEREWHPGSLQRLSLGLDAAASLAGRLGLSEDLAGLRAEMQAEFVAPLREWLAGFAPAGLEQRQGAELLDALSGLTDRLARLEDALQPPQAWWRRWY